ncbi:MAG: methionine--tRNA ligase [Candidatus Acidiferrales bacterium]
MPQDKPKFYITTPIYYANSRPHVGSAYTTIVCDVIARYKKMCGYDVAYLTGTDEHGVNIERAAEKQGISPRELVDRNHKIFVDLWKLLGIQYTGFVRTTSETHARAVQTLVRRTLKNSPDAIYKGKYEGRYCIFDNLYVSDTPEPVDCPTCGRPAELVSEENYFFRLSAYQEKLQELYARNPQFLVPDFRFNEIKSFVAAGLRDISISRKSIQWGIPWPGDPEHVFYVWYDALTSYMTGVGFGREGEGGAGAPEFKRYWPADVHAMGKEIIRFHAVYWPAFLMAAGIDLPKQIVAHGWLLFEQEKMSKSKGNVAYPEPIVRGLDDLAGAKVGNDALRYYLLRETVFGQDGNFSREALITRYNADLTNGLGNLAKRILTMISEYLGGIIQRNNDPRAQSSLAEGVFRRFPQIHPAILEDYDSFNFVKSLDLVWGWIAQVDSFLTHLKPWEIGLQPERWNEDWTGPEKHVDAVPGWESDPSLEGPTRLDALQQMVYVAAETLRCIVVLAHPVVPEATQRIWEQLGQTGKLADQRIDQLQWGGLEPGTKIGKVEGVFPRIKSKAEALEKIEAMENEIRNPGAAQPAAAATSQTATTSAGAATATGQSGSQAANPVPLATPIITIEDFAKIDLRVGIVKSAERIPGADKLLKLLVDLGGETRQILSGIAPAYTPEELVGRKVVVVANLAPRKMRGLESAGMILAASAGADGKPILCTFADDIAPGAKVK